METLKNLLMHPAFVRDAIAKEIYDIEDLAAQKKNYVKLRDRALGNLLFQEEEVNALQKIFTALARKIERKAEKIKLSNAENKGEEPKKIDLIKLLDFPTLNLKYLLIEVGKKLHLPLEGIAEEKQNNFIYLSIYDQIRYRTAQHPNLLTTLTEELLAFARFLSAQMEKVRQERKTYQFGKQYKKKEQPQTL